MGSVITMEQGALLQHQPQFHNYPLSADHEYADHFPGHAHHHHHHHAAYTTGGAVDQLRRDGSTPIQPPAPFSFTPTNNATGARYMPDRAVASDTSSYQQGTIFTDSGSGGSISTSPSSAASSLAYTSNPHAHYTNIGTLPGLVQQPQAFVQGPYAGPRVPSILDSTGSGMLPPPTALRSPITGPPNAAEREAFASSTQQFLARSHHLPPHTPTGFGSYPDTPRSLTSLNSLSLHQSAQYPPASNMSYPQPVSDCSNFPWPTLEVLADITCEGQSVTPDIHAKVEKGFFLSTVDQKWTCYRRNYFSVQCHFELHPTVVNGRMYLKRNNSTSAEPIQAMGMRLSAAVDGSQGKSIELVQHTPKRDAGPKCKIEVTKVAPTPSVQQARDDHHTVSPHGIYQVPMSTYHATGQIPGPQLPFQHSLDAQSPPSSSHSTGSAHMSPSYPYTAAPASSSHLSPLPGQNSTHTFERVQFKQATANNGKRRASQQYFHLIVELFADVRKEAHEAPAWVKVAHRVSEKIVVRGRSPSHYQNEGQHSGSAGGGRAGSSGSGGGYSGSGAGGYGHLGSGGGGYRGSSSSGGYGNSMSNGGGGSRYHNNHGGCGHDHEHEHEHSGSSSSSPADGGEEFAGGNGGDAIMSDAERAEIQNAESYRYYPGAIYENMQQQTLPKLESGVGRFSGGSAGGGQWAVKAEFGENVVPGAQWPAGGMGRFQGVESSRGYFPEMAVGYS